MADLKKLSQEDHDAAMKALQLRREQLEIQKLERDVQHLELGDQTLLSKAKQNGATLLANQRQDAQIMANCTHRKGGKGVEAVKGGGKGNSERYCVIKHQLPNGDIGILCQRCPRIWLPPVSLKPKSEYESGTAYQEAAAQFRRDEKEYREALNYQTDNEMSTSGLWTGGNDGGNFVRESRTEMHTSAGH